jgi:hypothetical protein
MRTGICSGSSQLGDGEDADQIEEQLDVGDSLDAGPAAHHVRPVARCHGGLLSSRAGLRPRNERRGRIRAWIV